MYPQAAFPFPSLTAGAVADSGASCVATSPSADYVDDWKFDGATNDNDYIYSNFCSTFSFSFEDFSDTAFDFESALSASIRFRYGMVTAESPVYGSGYIPVTFSITGPTATAPSVNLTFDENDGGICDFVWREITVPMTITGFNTKAGWDDLELDIFSPDDVDDYVWLDDPGGPGDPICAGGANGMKVAISAICIDVVADNTP